MGESLKKAKKVGIRALILVLCSVVVVWLASQPKKSLSVSVVWMPPMPESLRREGPYSGDIEGGQQLAYGVRYVWDGVPDELPWWIITKVADGKWRVCEAANSNKYDPSSTRNAVFDGTWIDGGFRCIGRSRVQKFQHIAFGTDHKFRMEKETLKTVQELIKIQEGFELAGLDLYDAMKGYIEERPSLATFWPPSRDFYESELTDLEKDRGEKVSFVEEDR